MYQAYINLYILLQIHFFLIFFGLLHPLQRRKQDFNKWLVLPSISMRGLFSTTKSSQSLHRGCAQVFGSVPGLVHSCKFCRFEVNSDLIPSRNLEHEISFWNSAYFQGQYNSMIFQFGNLYDSMSNNNNPGCSVVQV